MANTDYCTGAHISKWGFACIACLLGALMLVSALFAGSAYADEAEGKPAEGKPTVTTANVGFMLGNDYVWAGESDNISEQTIPNDILAAGRTIRVSDTAVGGSVRAVGQDVSLSNVAVTENVTIAGASTLVEGGTANSVCMAGQETVFSGECSELRMYAETVVIDGTVHGDVRVAAGSVQIGPKANIEGTLHVTTSAEPSVDEAAKVGKLDVKIEENANVSSEQLAGALAGFGSVMFIFGLVVAILGTFIIAVLAEWLFKRHTAAAAMMIRERTGATIGTGIVGALVAPIVIIILCCLVVTLPIAGALALALIAMSLVAEGFMGASVFKLAFPNLGRFKVALIGGAIMGVASAIPFLGALVGVAAFMYFLGYVLQTIFLSLREGKSEQPPAIC